MFCEFDGEGDRKYLRLNSWCISVWYLIHIEDFEVTKLVNLNARIGWSDSWWSGND